MFIGIHDDYEVSIMKKDGDLKDDNCGISSSGGLKSSSGGLAGKSSKKVAPKNKFKCTFHRGLKF